MKFAQPIWLLAGLIACAVFVWRYRRFDALQQYRCLSKFASASLIAQSLTASAIRRAAQLKRVLVVPGVAGVAIALARPLAGFRWEEARRKGLDVMIALDTSKSMLSQDVKPDRLTHAKMAVEDLLEKMDGDRIGLVAFAGNARFCNARSRSITTRSACLLDACDTPKIIPRGGTDIAAGDSGNRGSATEGNGSNERILVLLTDGDLGGGALDAARGRQRMV